MGTVTRRVLTANGMVNMDFEIKSQEEVKTPVTKLEPELETNTEDSSEELPTVEDKDITDMSDAELKAKCKELGLSAAGSKSAKINRILEATQSGEDEL